ncbi:MAG: hypothetical protein GEV03_27880 [Streptosporangiales bacterium]|nr:hypothetical protein [Streptosporangiales bacterium]
MVFGTSLTLALIEVRPGGDVRSVLAYSGTGGLLLILLGLVWTAGDHRHRTIVATALAAPRRPSPFAAQMLALAVVGVLVGLAAGAFTVAITVAWLGVEGVPLGVSGGVIAVAVAGGALYSGLAAALGGGLGALTRNQVAAAIVLFLYLSSVDPLLAMAVPDYGQFGPTALGIALSGGAETPGGPGMQLLPIGAAAAVWAGYAAVLIATGLAVTVRRDLR